MGWGGLTAPRGRGRVRITLNLHFTDEKQTGSPFVKNISRRTFDRKCQFGKCSGRTLEGPRDLGELKASKGEVPLAFCQRVQNPDPPPGGGPPCPTKSAWALGMESDPHYLCSLPAYSGLPEFSSASMSDTSLRARSEWETAFCTARSSSSVG